MLEKKRRVIKTKDFQNILKNGKFFRGKTIDLKITKNNLSISRFGFSVGLKISKKATQRNHTRRHLQESVRSLKDNIKQGFDILVIPRKEALKKDYQEKKKELEGMMEKAGIIIKKND